MVLGFMRYLHYHPFKDLAQSTVHCYLCKMVDELSCIHIKETYNICLCCFYRYSSLGFSIKVIVSSLICFFYRKKIFVLGIWIKFMVFSNLFEMKSISLYTVHFFPSVRLEDSTNIKEYNYYSLLY